MKVPEIFVILVVGSVLARNVNKKQSCDPSNLIHSSEGDLKIGFLINNCNNSSDKAYVNTLINSAIFTRDHVNALEYVKPFKLGISVHEVCVDRDFYKAIFSMFRENDEKLLLGMISTKQVPAKITDFCEVLEVPRKVTSKFWMPLVKASVKLLSSLNWRENITVISPHQNILQEFHRYTRREWMCIRKAYIFDKNMNFLDLEGPAVIFGNQEQIQYIANQLLFQQELEEEDLIFAPLDGLQTDGLPNGSYIIQPPLSDSSQFYSTSSHLINTPLFFEVANPMLTYVSNISQFVTDNCNDTLYKYNCVLNKLPKQMECRLGKYTPMEILKALKMDAADKFNYNIFRVEDSAPTNNNSSRFLKELTTSMVTRAFVYNMFNDDLISLESSSESNTTNFTHLNHMCSKSLERCLVDCVNFKTHTITRGILLPAFSQNVRFRSESWVFAFLSISVLGCLFCIAILIFLLFRVCKRDMFEGNPSMTIMLVITVICMYCAVVPFALEGNKVTRNAICVSRSLSLTLSFASAFSLLLSRMILLATVSKEIGFMSHISGSVQSFLCLFIFGVQCALSLQVISHCSVVFRGLTMIYLLSYNIILLLLLVCICPLVSKSQRNYREGKYYTISILLIACAWSCWLPGYAVLEDEWKDPLLCLGLVSTASIFLGAVFIPRTYLMTIAAARDRLTSALPCLGNGTSTLDIYRANAQPVYDCVNVAAIHAATMSKHLVAPPPPPQPDLYSCPTLPEDFDVQNCESPTRDKVTRF